jgi:hypothetical protein
VIRAVALVLALASPAAADRLVALAGNDPRTAIAVGPSGEVYEPDAQGAWQRTKPGGIGPTVTTSARTATATIAGTAAGAFRLGATSWSVIYLGQHAKPIVASGSRPVAAVGRQVFVVDHAPAVVAMAPSAITAIGATPSGIVVATATGVLRLDGKAFVSVPHAPATVSGFAGDRYALVGGGGFDMKSGKSIAWAGGDAVTATSEATDESLVAAATTASGVVFLRVPGAPTGGTIERDSVGVSGTPIGVAADRDRAVIALADGRICVREHGTWTTQTIRDALPAPRPGAPPAASH